MVSIFWLSKESIWASGIAASTGEWVAITNWEFWATMLRSIRTRESWLVNDSGDSGSSIKYSPPGTKRELKTLRYLVKPKTSSLRIKKPLWVRSCQESFRLSERSLRLERVLSLAMGVSPIVCELTERARLSRKVDFPEPFSPTKKVIEKEKHKREQKL